MYWVYIIMLYCYLYVLPLYYSCKTSVRSYWREQSLSCFVFAVYTLTQCTYWCWITHAACMNRICYNTYWIATVTDCIMKTVTLYKRYTSTIIKLVVIDTIFHSPLPTYWLSGCIRWTLTQLNSCGGATYWLSGCIRWTLTQLNSCEGATHIQLAHIFNFVGCFIYWLLIGLTELTSVGEFSM